MVRVGAIGSVDEIFDDRRSLGEAYLVRCPYAEEVPLMCVGDGEKSSYAVKRVDRKRTAQWQRKRALVRESLRHAATGRLKKAPLTPISELPDAHEVTPHAYPQVH